MGCLWATIIGENPEPNPLFKSKLQTGNPRPLHALATSAVTHFPPKTTTAFRDERKAVKILRIKPEVKIPGRLHLCFCLRRGQLSKNNLGRCPLTHRRILRAQEVYCECIRHQTGRS